MKKIMLLLYTVSLLTVSCHKDEQDSSDSSQTESPSTATMITNAVTDYDGNKYDAVKIGNQIWMASNLRTTHFSNGDAIPRGINDTDGSIIEPFCYYPNNSANNVSLYGYLYNKPAVMHGESASNSNPSGVQGICPNGWHVPSDEEWTELKNTVSSKAEFRCGNCESCIVKALSATTGWANDNGQCNAGNDQSTNNATGFSARPAGFYKASDAEYQDFGNKACFWSATNYVGPSSGYSHGIYYNSPMVNTYPHNADDGLSVRCVKD